VIPEKSKAPVEAVFGSFEFGDGADFAKIRRGGRAPWLAARIPLRLGNALRGSIRYLSGTRYLGSDIGGRVTNQ
jgi:hypothetical protein